MSETDTTAAPADKTDRRFASRKWRLTLLMIVMVTVPFALGLMGVELWVGTLLAMQLTYMGGNVGDTLASGLTQLLSAALQRGKP